MNRMVFLLIACTLLTTVSIFGQEKIFDKSAKKAVRMVTAKYKLDKDQVKKLKNIHTEYLANLEEISSLQNSNPTLYLEKRKAIRKVTDGALFRILDKDQTKLHLQFLKERALKEKELYATLKKAGNAYNDQILRQFSEIY